MTQTRNSISTHGGEQQVAPLLQEITLRNFLSFGPDTKPTPLQPLNVLIGPNGSGKSNLLEAVSLIRSTPRDLRETLLRGGGVTEWIWKGAQKKLATIDVVVSHEPSPLRHLLAFREEGQAFRLIDERIENHRPDKGRRDVFFYYRLQGGRPAVNVAGKRPRHLERESVDVNDSILAQRRDPETYPEITYLAHAYDDIRIYQDWAFGRRAIFREPQKADTRNDRLAEDFSNLGLFLNRLRRQPRAKKQIIEALRDFYEGLSDFETIVEGGTVQVFFTEGDYTIPATRLSDGTLRYLCLLSILCDPSPPRLVCIEEPELGLHPDILPKIANLLIDASSRAQLVVTTHSDIIVNALSHQPESVIVCEKHEGQTTLRRLELDKLKMWLEEYRLGELWIRGDLGGTRW